MKRKRHKHKLDQVMLVTPDEVNADIKQYKVHPWINRFLVAIICILLGGLIGYFYFENDQREQQREINFANSKEKQELEAQKAELESQIVTMQETIQILSETVNQKVQTIDSLTAELNVQFLPTGFPLSNRATMSEGEENEDPKCVFTALKGAMVIAAGSGTVLAINDDAEYGHNIWIDHGNGYVTVYRNSGEVKVKQGEKVSKGNTLFIIGGDNCKMEYQMMLDGVLIDPMDMLEISG